MHTSIHDVGGADRLVAADPRRINADSHKNCRFALAAPYRVSALTINVGVRIHPGLDHLVDRRLVQAEDAVHCRNKLLLGVVAKNSICEEPHLLVEDFTSLVLIGDRLHPIRILGLLLPRPLRLPYGVKVISVPDVQSKREGWVAPFYNTVELLIEVLGSFEPHAFPD